MTNNGEWLEKMVQILNIELPGHPTLMQANNPELGSAGYSKQWDMILSDVVSAILIEESELKDFIQETKKEGARALASALREWGKKECYPRAAGASCEVTNEVARKKNFMRKLNEKLTELVGEER